jgi:hypothetical protein
MQHTIGLRKPVGYVRWRCLDTTPGITENWDFLT